MDSSTDQTMMFDVMLPDTHMGMSDGPMSDGSKDGGGGDGSFDGPTVGNCSPVNGPACDIVLQNCPSGKECVVVGDPDAALGATTACMATQPSEHDKKGALCCPNNVNNPCDPGMTCVGSPCVGDGGSGGGGGRCSPACCPATDASPGSNNCGTSPEGFPGQCDLNLTYNSKTIYEVCNYQEPCTALGVKPCPKGSGCEVEDMSGTSTCVGIFGPDGGNIGAGAGENCGQFSNFCADGLMCITFGMMDAGQCTWMCYTGATTPFDASVLNTSKPGTGGCPGGSTCQNSIPFLPPWLGLCVPP